MSVVPVLQIFQFYSNCIVLQILIWRSDRSKYREALDFRDY